MESHLGYIHMYTNIHTKIIFYIQMKNKNKCHPNSMRNIVTLFVTLWPFKKILFFISHVTNSFP